MFDMTRTAFGGMVLATALLLGTLVFTAPNEGEAAKSTATFNSMPSQQMSKSLQKVM